MTADEPDYLRGLLWACFAGLTTVLGAIFIPCLNQKNQHRLTAGALAFAAGVMLWVSFVDVLAGASAEFFGNHFTAARPDDELNGVWVRIVIFFFFFLGILTTWQLQRITGMYLDHDHHHAAPHVSEAELASQVEQGRAVAGPMSSSSVMDLRTKLNAEGGQAEGQELNDETKRSLKKVSMVAMVALALHNFPEGLATFFDASTGSMTIALAIAMHNIPEGAAIAIPMYQATGSLKEALVATSLAGLTQPLGALMGWAFIVVMGIGDITAFAYGVIYTITAGIMVGISILELIPAAFAYPDPQFCSFCLFSGFFVMEVSIILLEFAL